MLRSTALAISVAIVASGCVGHPRDQAAECGVINRGALDVSLVQLIATPARFNGKQVRLKGYLNLEFEGNGLYLTRDSYRHLSTNDAVWVDLASCLEPLLSSSLLEPKRGYALVEGIFVASDTGHMGLFSGALHEVSRVEFNQHLRP